MDPATTCCPNLACPARGQTGQGNTRIHSCKEQRFMCTECPKTFTATKGTAFYRLRTPAEVVTLVLPLRAHGCPLQAIVVAFGCDERTVAHWLARAGRQGHAVQEHVVEQPHDLGEVQADEIRVKTQRGIVWMAPAMMVSTRLWLVGEVSEPRDLPLIRRLIKRVHAGALPRALLFCTDGLCSYVSAVRQTCRDVVHSGARGRPRLRLGNDLCMAQVVKRSEKRRVVAVERRIVEGSPAQVEQLRPRAHGAGVIHTASSERLPATCRERWASLTRRGRALARHTLTLQHGRSLIGTVYHFCTPHASLGLPGPTAGASGIQRTPAMATGLTDHCWTVRELLAFPVPPPRWTPPKQRGRPSQVIQRRIERWCS
jgi:transposase-like protein